MELIYTDSELNDIGVLKEATSDFAFGKDENDFEIATTKKYASLILGGYIYYDNTEYGGIVDSVKASNNNDEIKYNGRTWHGMLNSFIMDFDSEYMNYDGTQYSVINGVQAKDLVAELVEKTELPITVDDSFEKELEPVSVDARIGLYDFLVAVLKPSMLKMYFRYNKGLTLYVSGASQFDESANFDSKQMMITATKNRKFTNHFVLHNYQESENAHRILNLYTDEVGNLQPYTNVENPLRDIDYFDATKILTGADEVVSLLEDTSSKESYRLEDASVLNINWKRVHLDYYEYKLKEGTEDEYEYVQLKDEDAYVEITSQPSDWEWNWHEYYKKTGENSYTQLSDEDNADNVSSSYKACYRNGSHPQVTEDLYYMPQAKWEREWDSGSYFTRTWDGNKWVYQAVQGRDDYGLEKLASPPTDWSSNKGDYIVNDSLITYKVVRGNKTKKGIKTVANSQVTFTNHNYKKYKVVNPKNTNKKITLRDLCKETNKWYKSSGNTYYKKISEVTDNSPVKISIYCSRRGRSVGGFKFGEVNNVYRQYVKEKKLPPIWQEPNQDHSNPKGYFLKITTSNGSPTWQYITEIKNYDVYAQYDYYQPYAPNKFYAKVQDHFASLIEKAKEQLADELSQLEGATAELNIETYEFDVGDYVGGINPLTNEPFKSIVTKKIAKINSFNAEVSYEIG